MYKYDDDQEKMQRRPVYDDSVRRPILLSIIAIILFIEGAIIICTQTAYILHIGNFPVWPYIPSTLQMLIMSVLIGLFELLMGIGCWKGWKPVWYIMVLGTVISIVLNILPIISSPDLQILYLVLWILILIYMFKYNVREYFGF
jgi:hypothetical protein